MANIFWTYSDWVHYVSDENFTFICSSFSESQQPAAPGATHQNLSPWLQGKHIHVSPLLLDSNPLFTTRKSNTQVKVFLNTNVPFKGLSAWNGAEQCNFLLHVAILGPTKMALGQLSLSCPWQTWEAHLSHSLLPWSILSQPSCLSHTEIN